MFCERWRAIGRDREPIIVLKLILLHSIYDRSDIVHCCKYISLPLSTPQPWLPIHSNHERTTRHPPSSSPVAHNYASQWALANSFTERQERHRIPSRWTMRSTAHRLVAPSSDLRFSASTNAPNTCRHHRSLPVRGPPAPLGALRHLQPYPWNHYRRSCPLFATAGVKREKVARPQELFPHIRNHVPCMLRQGHILSWKWIVREWVMEVSRCMRTMDLITITSTATPDDREGRFPFFLANIIMIISIMKQHVPFVTAMWPLLHARPFSTTIKVSRDFHVQLSKYLAATGDLQFPLFWMTDVLNANGPSISTFFPSKWDSAFVHILILIWVEILISNYVYNNWYWIGILPQWYNVVHGTHSGTLDMSICARNTLRKKWWAKLVSGCLTAGIIFHSIPLSGGYCHFLEQKLSLSTI